MSELTPDLKIPYPSEFEENYFRTSQNGSIQSSSIMQALAENDNMVFLGGGNFSWSTVTNVLSWSEGIGVRTFTSPFRGTISAASFELEDGDILFFKMFRKLTANFAITILKGKLIQSNPVRLNDLILFAYREGNVVYLPSGQSIVNGELGPAFGGGLVGGTAGTPSDHVHLPTVKLEGLAAATTGFNVGFTTPILLQMRLWRNGSRQSEGDDYTFNPATGAVLLVKPVVSTAERFLWDIIRTP